MQITVSTNFPQIQKRLNQLQDEIATKATVRGVNRTVEIGQTQMRRTIGREFNLPAAKIREKLFLKRASFKGGRFNVEAVLESRDPRGKRRSINVINFAARQTAAGVSVKIKRGGARQTIKGAFIGNKGRTVFERTSQAKANKKRLPIRPVQAIDVPQMFNSRRVKDAVVRVIRQRFPEVMAREIQFYTQRFGAR